MLLVQRDYAHSLLEFPHNAKDLNLILDVLLYRAL